MIAQQFGTQFGSINYSTLWKFIEAIQREQNLNKMKIEQYTRIVNQRIRKRVVAQKV